MLTLAYACSWWRPVETTWSGSAAGLRKALALSPDVDLVDVAVEPEMTSAAVLACYGMVRGYGNWKFSTPHRRLTDRRVRRRLSNLDVDVVIGVGDVETVGHQPTFLYQDASFSVLQAHRDLLSARAPEHIRFPSGRLDQLVDEQRATYAAAAGVLSFSTWFADWLVEHDGVPRERVHVVGGGLSALPTPRDLTRRGAGGHRVLFIGRDFHRKGGDLVVEAVARMRDAGAGDFRLTVVGPAQWPLPGEVPEWVDFLGEVPAERVATLWSQHDVFALPTWYEPYGLVFLEALAAGVPILGREAYCMPELVPPTSGRLIPAGGGADQVAELLAAMASDQGLFEAAAAGADQARAEWTWERAASRAMAGIRGGIT